MQFLPRMFVIDRIVRVRVAVLMLVHMAVLVRMRVHEVAVPVRVFMRM